MPKRYAHNPKDRARFLEHCEKVRNILSPYHARLLDEMPYGLGVARVYVLYSREADAGTPDDPRHELRGMVTMLITGDGSTQFNFSEEMVSRALGDTPSNTWESTEATLSKLIPSK